MKGNSHSERVRFEVEVVRQVAVDFTQATVSQKMIAKKVVQMRHLLTMKLQTSLAKTQMSKCLVWCSKRSELQNLYCIFFVCTCKPLFLLSHLGFRRIRLQWKSLEEAANSVNHTSVCEGMLAAWKPLADKAERLAKLCDDGLSGLKEFVSHQARSSVLNQFSTVM